MATDTRTAAELAEQRLELAAQVKSLRDEIIAASDDVRHEKAAELEAKVNALETLDRETQLVSRLEQSDEIIKRLASQPSRPAPVKVADYGHFAKINPATGEVVGGFGIGEVDESAARQSYEYHKAFQALLKARGKVDRIDSRNHRDMIERYGKADTNEFFIPFTKDMTIGTTTNGSNAIAPDFRFDVITPRTVTPVMTRVCRVINTNVTSVTFPKNSDANSDTRYGTSFRPVKGETPNTTLSKIDTGPFTQLVIPVNTGTMYTDVSSDFLADAPGMSAYIQGEAAKAFAAVVDDEVINGVTGSTQAEGVLTNASVGITKTGSNNTLVPTKIVDAFYAFREQYSTSLAWCMARGTHGKLVNLLDAQNRSLFLPSYDGGYVPGPQANLLGAPVVFNEFVPASGTSTPKSIVVGDWNEYILLMRQGYTLMIDDMSLAYQNRIRMTVKYRFGGAVRDVKAFRIVHELA